MYALSILEPNYRRACHCLLVPNPYSGFDMYFIGSPQHYWLHCYFESINIIIQVHVNYVMLNDYFLGEYINIRHHLEDITVRGSE